MQCIMVKIICKIHGSFQKINISMQILLIIQIAISLEETFVVLSQFTQILEFCVDNLTGVNLILTGTLSYPGRLGPIHDVCVRNISCQQRMKILSAKMYRVKQASQQKSRYFQKFTQHFIKNDAWWLPESFIL